MALLISFYSLGCYTRSLARRASCGKKCFHKFRCLLNLVCSYTMACKPLEMKINGLKLYLDEFSLSLISFIVTAISHVTVFLHCTFQMAVLANAVKRSGNYYCKAIIRLFGVCFLLPRADLRGEFC